MLEFGKLEIVNKTFTRESGKPRGQGYDGIKFRRAETKKANSEGIDEKFIISDAAFEKLNLTNLALTQAKIDGSVLLLVLEDVEGAVPAAKFLRQSTKKDGSKQKKGKFFSNDFLTADLIETGVLKAEEQGNQYLALNDVTSEVNGLPSHVKAVYQITADTTVDASADEEETEEAEEVEADEKDFK